MTAPSTQKGRGLEHRVAAYFQAHGYFVRTSVTLSVAAGTKDATDIDVLAIRFTPPMLEERVVADCKDRKRAKPFERILWTRGLASFAHATAALVVVRSAPWQAREFGAVADIQLVQSSIIDNYLSSLTGFIPFAEADPVLSGQLEAIRAGITKDRTTTELYRQRLRVRQLLVLGNPITGFNRAVRAVTAIHDILSRSTGSVRELAQNYLRDAAAISSIMLVRFACNSRWTPEKDWTSNLEKKLTYGDFSPHKAQQLAGIAFQSGFHAGLPAPHYVDEVTQLVKHFIAHPLLAATVPPALDARLFGKSSHNGLPSVIPRPHDEILRLSRRVLSVISYAAQIPGDVWTETPKTPQALQSSKQPALPLEKHADP